MPRYFVTITYVRPKVFVIDAPNAIAALSDKKIGPTLLAKATNIYVQEDIRRALD
jgi:hypothetical protein